MKQKEKPKTGKGDIQPPPMPPVAESYLDKKAEKYLRDSGKIEDMPEEERSKRFVPTGKGKKVDPEQDSL